MKKIPKEIKKEIKQDIRNRVQDINAMTSKPIQKFKNKLIGINVTRSALKNARQTGDYYPVSNPYEKKTEDMTTKTPRYAKMKTGGMVNPNASVSATKVSKGRPVKSAEPKSAAKKATGRVGGISKAPKAANPKK
jgi:hypothetical protein